MAQYPPQPDVGGIQTETDPVALAALAGLTPAAIGAATPAQITAAVAPLATTSSLNAAIAGITPISIGAATPTDIDNAVSPLATTASLNTAISGVTSASIGAAASSSLAAEITARQAGDIAAVQLAPVAQQTIVPTVNVVPLVLQGAIGGNADLQQWYNGAGSKLISIGSSGRLIMGVDAAARMNISPTAANQTPLVVRGFASQSNDLQQWQDSGGTVRSSINAAGALLVRTVSQFGSSALSIGASSASAEVVTVRGFASQTADLQKWQTSTGADVARVGPTGQLIANGSDPAQASLIVKGATSQSTNLQEWQTSTGTVQTAVTQSGGLFTSREMRLGMLTSTVGGAAGIYLGLANVTTAPSTAPTGGGVLYALGGALFWRGSSGTSTQIAPA